MTVASIITNAAITSVSGLTERLFSSAEPYIIPYRAPDRGVAQKIAKLLTGRKLIMDSDGYPRSWIILAVILIYKGFCTVCESAVAETDRRKLRSCENSKRCRILGKLTHSKLYNKPTKKSRRTLQPIIMKNGRKKGRFLVCL